MGTAKLHINLIQGLIDVEGEEALVLKVYEDFREQLALAARATKVPSGPHQEVERTSADNEVPAKHPVKPTTKRRTASAKASSAGGDKKGAYSPTIDASLETQGLLEFYSQYTPKNLPEKILIFLKFLHEKKNISPATADQIYTCLRDTRQKLPEHYVQALRDAKSKPKYIEFSSMNDISMTVRGENHINHEMSVTTPA